MYAKLFASLYQGTLRGNPDEILVFTNLLAHADSTGVVDKHWRAIAEEVGISRERVEAAISNLEAPDPESRSPEENGCRIVKMDEHRVWGWRIVNHGKYRAIRDEDDRREQNRLAQERWRNKNKPRKPISAQAEAEAEAEALVTTTPRVERVRASAPVAAKKEKDDGKFRLAADWRPDLECRAYAADRGLDPEATADVFTDYFHNRKGKSERRDAGGWIKRWQIWCRTDAERAGPMGKATTRAVKSPRGNEAFYDELAVISNRSRSSG